MITPEQQIAFEFTALEMRKNGGQLSLQELTAIALSKLTVVAKEWNSQDRKNVAGIVAQSIYSRFDLTKIRPPAKDPRSAKLLREAEVVKFVHGAEQIPSVRTIAKQFGISNTVAHDILTRSGLSRHIQKIEPTLSETAVQLLALMASELPNRSTRLLDFAELSRALNCDESVLRPALAEIERVRQPLVMLETGIPTGRIAGSTWLVVQRGKIKSKHDMLQWATAVARSFSGNVRARIDQRFVLQLSDPQLGNNAVLKDACAVLLISNGSTSMRTWRAFLNASANVGSESASVDETIIVHDPGAILNALNGAIRRGNLLELLPKMHDWLVSDIDRVAAAEIFRLASALNSDHFFPPVEAILFWATATNYRERIAAGNLPGRRVEDFDMLSSYRDVIDADVLYGMFLQNPDSGVLHRIYADVQPSLASQTDFSVQTSEYVEEGDDQALLDGGDADAFYGYIYPPSEDD